jgi:hypothetical protein
VTTLGAPNIGLRPHDLKWIRTHGSRTLAEIEEVTHRLVALRAWGVTQGAALLGVSHGALSRWARRRRIRRSHRVASKVGGVDIPQHTEVQGRRDLSVESAERRAGSAPS